RSRGRWLVKRPRWQTETTSRGRRRSKRGSGRFCVAEREASDEQMIAATEHWAKIAGRWRDDGPVSGRRWLEAHTVLMPGVVVRRWDRGQTGFGRTFNIDSHTALLWALLEHAGTTIDVGPCHACVKRG